MHPVSSPIRTCRHHRTIRNGMGAILLGLAGICFFGTAVPAGQAQPKSQLFLNCKATAVTAGPKHHFFGYYDKCPWDKTGRYLLANEVDFCDRQPRPGEPLTV